MIVSESIRKMAEDKLEGTDLFLVDVSVKPGNRIFVYLDGDHGVTIDDCAELSRHLNTLLEEEANHELVVSSSGADQPIRLYRQYRKNIGRSLTVKLKDNQTVSGILEQVTDSMIVLRPDKQKKKKGNTQQETPETLEIPFENIETAKVNITFNK